MSLEEIPLEVLSYSDSLFTNPHDLVSSAPVNDGRGTFTHLGVKMEGLESARHLNFKALNGANGVVFNRDNAVTNEVRLRVKDSKVASVSEIEFDTAFYTRNNVNYVFTVTFVSDLDGSEVVVLRNLKLDGDAKKLVKLDKPENATRIILHLGEGGLARFKARGVFLKESLKRLESLLTSAKVFSASDASYGDPKLVLRSAREGSVMAGWESCRHSARHALGIDLGKSSHLMRIEIDTYMHRLNAFKYVAVLGTTSEEPFDKILKDLPKWKVKHGAVETVVSDQDLNDYHDKNAPLDSSFSYEITVPSNGSWRVLLPMSPLQPDTLHTFEKDFGLVSRIMLLGVPDGGIHRVGFYGK